MRHRILVPSIIISVTVLLGVAVVAAVAVSGLSAEEPGPQLELSPTDHTPVPPTRALTPLPFTQTEVKEAQKLPETSGLQTRIQSVESADVDGTVYTWRDGDRSMRVVLQTGLTVQPTEANKPEDVVVLKGVTTSIVQQQQWHGAEVQPVFRSESSGGLMTLPGGVLLVLDPAWDEAQIEDFFSLNDIPEGKRSELDFISNGFLIETEPGFPSFDLANDLADQPGVVLSSPNWQRELETQ